MAVLFAKGDVKNTAVDHYLRLLQFPHHIFTANVDGFRRSFTMLCHDAEKSDITPARVF